MAQLLLKFKDHEAPVIRPSELQRGSIEWFKKGKSELEQLDLQNESAAEMRRVSNAMMTLLEEYGMMFRRDYERDYGNYVQSFQNGGDFGAPISFAEFVVGDKGYCLDLFDECIQGNARSGDEAVTVQRKRCQRLIRENLRKKDRQKQ